MAGYTHPTQTPTHAGAGHTTATARHPHPGARTDPSRAYRRWAWAGIIGTGVAYEAWALRHDNDATLSATVRHALQTRTRVGKLLFLSTLFAASAWFAQHIVNGEDITAAIDSRAQKTAS